MKPTPITKTCALPDGRTITIETGKLARQADGSVVLRMGNTMLLATVVSNKEGKEGADFLPLSVDYQEKFASTGKIPGGFLRREGRLSDYEILISRLVDRAIRPLFPDDYHAETQVIIQLISGHEDGLPDALAAFAASAALSVSDIPFQGPISEVRVARVDGQYIVNPTLAQKEKADLDLIVAASIENILMVEGEAKEVSEDDMLAALKVAHEAIKVQCQLQIELTKETNKTVKRTYSHEKNDPALKEELFKLLYDKAYAVARLQTPNKQKRSELFHQVEEEYINSLPADTTIDKGLVKKYYHDIQKKACRDLVLNERVRLDGRKTTEIRSIWTEIDYLPSAHGSAIFTRGETQSLSTVTLGTKLDEQMIDGAMFSGNNKFMLHYNFPSFSTGEVKPNRGPGRREIGHGNLAYRSLKQVLPADDANPYTIRIVSDILESNGSSSMATVCAGSLALMDAGLPIKAAVSGIAMGMISDKGRYAILSDILGDEDHLGDMDFKVTGTTKGITGCQMDLKVDGLTYDVLKEALLQAKEGRLHILNEMSKTIQAPKADLKPHAPRAHTIYIEKEMIGAVIGPGGKVVQDIQNTTGATVVIEEKDKRGIVSIFATNQAAMDGAMKRINAIVAVPEVGATYDGIVKSIMPFGAFVEFMPGKDGLLHISEIKWERLETMDGVMEVGEQVKVKLVEVDKKTGKFRLSRKVLLPKPPQKQEQAPA
ncbi:MAG: polyribonucleotide nucleotidyltransferase [Cyclobacteriaceae bacterium]|jgi:polyribonucleotide nucleotidyltransferase|nr:polyribonucleotide nucleotidyltransferase [Cytophagales bacterium]HNP78210.1 polyribonucleotide nucleotidyltransferase [Cyclobacteriaceae bacterium]